MAGRRVGGYLRSDEFFAQMTTQKCKCGVCEKPIGKNPLADYDPETGRLRGLLCSDCFNLLDYAKDSTSILRKAVDYLVAIKRRSDGESKGKQKTRSEDESPTV